MKTLGVVLTLLAVSIVGSLVFETPTQAASTNPNPIVTVGNVPLPVTVGNNNANPVPVSVIAPAAARTVICTLNLNTVSLGAPFLAAIQAFDLHNLTCPDGVTKIDVQRILFAVDSGSTDTRNVATYRVTVTLFQDGKAEVLAMLTEGAPDALVMRPVRLDPAGSGEIGLRESASSGIVGFVPSLGGAILFVGTPAQ